MLAGGLVLGVGAAATLASWNDSEYAATVVTTSTFDLQSNVTNVPATFSSHPAGTPLVLDFAATNMTPTSLRHKQFFIRNMGTVAGTFTFSAPKMSADDRNFPLATYLKYRAIQTTGACTAASFTNAPASDYLAGDSAAWVAIGSAPSSVKEIAKEGVVVGICVQLQLDAATPNDRQGKSAAVEFVTTATSGTS